MPQCSSTGQSDLHNTLKIITLVLDLISMERYVIKTDAEKGPIA